MCMWQSSLWVWDRKIPFPALSQSCQLGVQCSSEGHQRVQREGGRLVRERGIAISGREHWHARCTAETGEKKEGMREKVPCFGVITQLVCNPDTYVLFSGRLSCVIYSQQPLQREGV